MAYLITIGNSQGLRIPKPIIKQANLAGRELRIEVVAEGLLIKPCRQAREGWQEAIARGLSTQDDAEAVDSAWLDTVLTADDDTL